MGGGGAGRSHSAGRVHICLDESSPAWFPLFHPCEWSVFILRADWYSQIITSDSPRALPPGPKQYLGSSGSGVGAGHGQHLRVKGQRCIRGAGTLQCRDFRWAERWAVGVATGPVTFPSRRPGEVAQGVGPLRGWRRWKSPQSLQASRAPGWGEVPPGSGWAYGRGWPCYRPGSGILTVKEKSTQLSTVLVSFT